MKKNYLFLIAASVALAFTACSTKELDLPEEKESGVAEEMKHVSLSATTENDNNTKVTLVGTTYGWSEGVDKLMVTTSNDEGSSYTLTESTAFSDGHFTLEYAGSRDGYAVIPSSFLTAYDGSHLTITYPSSYDISSYITDSYLTDGKYDAAGAYLPIPMIATSTERVSNLTFYALGALVRVTVSDVPEGTKKLYITFNQTVTGDFTVATPFTPGDNSVSVADSDTTPPTDDHSSTVEFIISTTGINSTQAANSFVLYIPVPTTSDLRIASSTKTKTPVARNMGYAWSVPAITHTYEGAPSYQTNGGTFVIAPGNLLAYNNGESIVYSFLSGTDQLITTKGALNNDPHTNYGDAEHPAAAPSCEAEGSYQDMFNWDQLRSILGDTGDYDVPYNITGTREISSSWGDFWKAPTKTIEEKLIDRSPKAGRADIRTGIKGTVHGFTQAGLARVRIDVNDSPYAEYALVDNTVPGMLWFPDGYVDQTDWVADVAYYHYRVSPAPQYPELNVLAFTSQPWDATPIIGYEAFALMVANGAVFMPAAGLYTNFGFGEYTTVGTVGYNIGATQTSKDGTTNGYCAGLNIAAKTITIGGRKSHYCGSVRLVREVTP